MTRQGPSLQLNLPHTVAYGRQGAYTCDNCGWLQIGLLELAVPANANGDLHLDNSDSIRWEPVLPIGQSFDDVPEHIAAAADEAYVCLNVGAFRGAAALARAVVESTAKAKGITQGVLYDKIEALEAGQHIRAYVKEAAHEVRLLGNEVAHGDFVGPVDRDEAVEILALMGEVLNEVFQSPARVQRFQAVRQAKQAGT